MCPHGYHHSGSMATPALGTRDVRIYISKGLQCALTAITIYIYIYIYLETIVNLLWQIYLIHMKQILYTFHLHIYIYFKDIHVTIYLVYNNYKYSISASMFAISFTLSLVHFSYILK